MMKRKEEMIQYAKQIHGNITPCAGKNTLLDCFTEPDEYGELILWFNRECGSCAILRDSKTPN